MPSKIHVLGAFVCTIIVLCLSDLAWAHRVNIFAWSEASDIVTESSFSNGSKVRHGRVTVYDAVTGEKLLEDKTNEQGILRFPAPAAGREHGLRIRIDAGEGHSNSWDMEPEDMPTEAPSQSLPAKTSKTESVSVPANTGKDSDRSSASSSNPLTTGPTALELRAIMEEILEIRLGPIRRELAEMRMHRPGMTEIVGGIGWLLGLAGIFLYFRGRRR
ncbi:MAG: cobalamin biosynthesis protein CbiL [Desulfovibrio sp.]|nr:cobalamin biosynthesis protein CbiL [Desulfovibrio sp.]